MTEKLLFTCLGPLRRSCSSVVVQAASHRLFPRDYPSIRSLRIQPSKSVRAAKLHCCPKVVPQRRNCTTVNVAPEPGDGYEAVIEARCRRRDVIPMVASVETGPEALNALRCLRDVRDIRPEERVALAEDVMKSLREHGETITESHYAELFRCYVESGLSGRLERLRDGMERDQVSMTREINTLILRELSGRGEVDESSNIVKTLKSDGISSDEIIGSLIHSYSTSGNVEKALKLLESVRESGSVGSNVCTAGLRALAESGRTEEFETVWTNSIIEDYQFSSHQLVSILETISKTDQINLIPKMMTDNRRQYVAASLSDLITKYVYSDDVHLAQKLLLRLMAEFKSSTDMEMYLIQMELCRNYIRDLFHVLSNSPKEVVEKCRELRRIRPEADYTLEHALHHYLRSSNITASFVLLQAMFNDDVQLRPHYFWPLIIEAEKKYSFEGVIEIVKRMEKLNVELDCETLNHVVFPRVPPRAVSSALKRLKTGLQFHFLQEAYVMYALRSGLFDECKALLEAEPLTRGVDYGFMEDACIAALTEYPVTATSLCIVKQTNALDASHLITYLMEHGQMALLRSLLPDLLRSGIGFKTRESVGEVLDLSNLPGDVAAAIKQLASASSSRDGKRLKESSYSLRQSIEKGEVNLFELESKRMNTISQRIRLIRWYVQAGMFDQAVREKDNIVRSLGSYPDVTPGMAVLFARLAAFEDNIQDVLHYHGIVKEKGIKYDVPKGVAVAICLMKNGHINEVLHIANNFNIRHDDITEVETKIVQLLRFFTEVGSPTTTNAVLMILVNNGVVKLNRNTVAILVDHHIQTGDLDGAVEKCEKIASTFKIVPATEKVLEATVEAGRFDLVDKLLAMGDDSVNTRGLIMLAAARTGRPEVMDRCAQKYDATLDLKTIRQLGYRNFSSGEITTLLAWAYGSVGDNQLVENFIGLALTHFRKSGTYDEVRGFCRKMKELGVASDLASRPTWRNLTQVLKFRRDVDECLGQSKTELINQRR